MELTYIKVFVDYLDAIELLGDAERGRLFTALLEYGRTGVAPQLGGNERFLFPMMRAQIDRDKASLEAESSTYSEAGKKGAKARWQGHKKDGLDSQAKPGHKKDGQNGKDKEEDKDKDKDKEEDIAPLLSPQGEVAQAQPAEISLPLISGALYPIYPADIDHWKQLYPSVDIRKELRKMLGWLEANPARQKTQKGIKRFVAAWLAKEQDKAPPKKNSSYDIDELEELSRFNLPEVM